MSIHPSLLFSQSSKTVALLFLRWGVIIQLLLSSRLSSLCRQERGKKRNTRDARETKKAEAREEEKKKGSGKKSSFFSPGNLTKRDDPPANSYFLLFTRTRAPKKIKTYSEGEKPSVGNFHPPLSRHIFKDPLALFLRLLCFLFFLLSCSLSRHV